MQALTQAYQTLANFYKQNDSGVVAIVGCPDEKDPELIHDLQIFADDDGFVSHADSDSIPEIASGFQGLFSNYNMQAQTPITGLVIANEWGLVKEKTSAMGAKFDVYGYDDVTGGIDLGPAS